TVRGVAGGPSSEIVALQYGQDRRTDMVSPSAGLLPAGSPPGHQHGIRGAAILGGRRRPGRRADGRPGRVGTSRHRRVPAGGGPVPSPGGSGRTPAPTRGPGRSPSTRGRGRGRPGRAPRSPGSAAGSPPRR